MSDRDGIYREAVECIITELKEHTALPAVVLQHRLREDFGFDLSSKEISAAIKKYGGRKITWREPRDSEMNFGFVYSTRQTRMYELRGRGR